MKLSILDQAPCPSGTTPREALQASMKLAQLGEKLGYTRYWIAEHHDLPGLTCSAPESMLGYIGAHTERIRLGSGAVLLPHYKPFKIAETFNLLTTLFPDRIDLGIGRAPGGSAEASIALSGNFLEHVRQMPESLKELLHFIHHDFPSDHMFSKVTASPTPVLSPQVWLLGTTEKSARLAAENGIAYAFGHFMSEKDGPEIVNTYLKHFNIKGRLPQPNSIVAVSVICAETNTKAQELALSEWMWKHQLAQGEGTKGIPSIVEAKDYFKVNEKGLHSSPQAVIGNPREVKEQLLNIQSLYRTDEIMIITITHRFEDRARSYELVAEEIFGDMMP